ncbi:ATP-dependent DNA helicase, partial [Caligus rogercresseyi]
MPPKKRPRLSRKTDLAARSSTNRSGETHEDRETRLLANRERHLQTHAVETREQRQGRLAADAFRNRQTRSAESVESLSRRNSANAARNRQTRSAESPESRSRRNSANAARTASSRRAETPLLREQRFGLSRPSVALWNREGFQYHPEVDYSLRPHTAIGKMNVNCRYCNAMKYPAETPGLCCANGKVRLDDLQETPDHLRNLLLGQSPDSKNFMRNIRAYNSAFQMTSFGHKSSHPGGYMPTFRIQGQVYHKIGSMLPVEGREHAFLQIYFMGDNEAEANRRVQVAPVTNVTILRPLQDMLHSNNRYVREFKTALERLEQERQSFRIIIRADKTPAHEHQRCYNRPKNNEVAVLIAGHDETTTNRDIVLEKQNAQLQRINELHPWYDALQYPLLFPCAEDGYRINIQQVEPNSRRPTAKTVSAMAFYAYRLMVRANSFNRLLRGRMLLHQYIVDMYAKRLNFIRHHQRELRVEQYVHLKDAVDRQTASNDQTRASDIGQSVILPYMHERTQDALTYVRKHGRPDLFITFTCNPNWEEITAHLLEEQSPDQRHDLIARVFHLKLKKMMQLFTSGNIFGKTICHMYTIEWQKRGLPHAHILLWLQDKLRSTDIDAIISAEFPDPRQDPVLFEVIKDHMVHGPCGDLNRNSNCMEKGKCTKRFPRQMLQATQTGEDGYPLYRRRTPEDGGFTARKKGLQLDNRWVVPHSPLLCKLFMSHINVEFCNSVKAIKYICKYINKGSDRAVFEVRREGATTDEVTQFQTGRYLSTNEATWRLFQFPIHARHPPVQHLSVHLENGQRVYFNQHTLTDRAADPQRTTLTAFFQLCNVDHFASHLLYCNVPQYYTWNNSKRLWVRRKQGCPVPGEDAIRAGDTLGRVYTVHPMNMECFCLRLLLHVVEGPTSFQALRTVEGEVCASFKEACSKRGLLEDDQHWDLTLEDALFAIMLVYCSLTNASQLWDKYRDSMTEDILLQARRQADDEYPQFTPTMYNQALIFLEDKVLEIGGCSLDNYALTTPDRIQQRLISRHMLRETSYANDLLQQYVDDNEPLLTPDQTDAYTKIMLKVNSGSAGILFLDAPGGTGKTFLLNLLLAKVRQNNQIALAVASSGIAATLLSGGRTAHSAFKLPLNLCHQENPVCSIRKGTDEANVLKETRLIVWDEATMAHKNALYALDKSLRIL